MERSSGVLMHISSLPNEYGIGSFGKSAYDFVDFLVETGQTYWQILPLTTTSFGDSPYSSYSAFAGNTHLIDLDLLVKADVLDERDLEDIQIKADAKKVDYIEVANVRRPLLEKAVQAFIKNKGLETEAYESFVTDNAFWLIPFAEFMTVKENQGDTPWYEWDDDFRNYEQDFIKEYCLEHETQMNYHLVTQFWFLEQWLSLKEYANNVNILFVGDIPIYVARDSVEMWESSHLFLVDEDKNPTLVAGVPPDAFSDTGQYWGNPIYDWEYMRKHNYEWWVQRTKENFKLYDVVRIDHFRGFESYWAIPFGAESAKEGSWVKGPDYELFKQIKKELGELKIIAEDLGFITEEVIDLREATGFPGMKILQHGFSGKDSLDLPHHYGQNTIAYVGTHDNPTALEWYQLHTTLEQRDQLDLYLNRRSGEQVTDALNRGIAGSQSRIVIYTMQDLLHLGEEARMNRPSTIGDNWDWRMTENALTVDVEERLRDWTETYFRLNERLLDKEEDAVEFFEDTESLVEHTEDVVDEVIEKMEVIVNKKEKNIEGEQDD